ncbi:MAG TPA: transposase [Usitatibacter sp.]|nr:transposase [Usitatibacter sp.]
MAEIDRRPVTPGTDPLSPIFYALFRAGFYLAGRQSVVMPRHARFLLPGHPLHIRQRGVNRERCFADDADRSFYLGLLQELLPESGCALHAYVLMNNHVHLLVTPATEDSAARLMKGLGQRHAQRCNKRWKRTGPLWDGRFKSSLVDSERYALTCHRYIEENAFRAKMVSHPAEYPWSSFHANALGYPCPFLTEHPTVRSLDPDPIERRIAYRRLFDTPQSEEELKVIRGALDSSVPTGSAAFLERVAIATGRKVKRRNRQLIKN